MAIMIQCAWCMVSRWSLWKIVWRASMNVAKHSENKNTKEPIEPTT